MTEPTSATPHYTMGFGETILRHSRRRTVHSHAAHLLTHLKPGLCALDLGCGPGTISVGLAKAIEPGELHGVDMEPSQVAVASAIAEAGGQGNATFHVGDVTDLPFDDDSFDLVHGHAVLTYIPDTQAALAEARRVLKPGGLISIREAVYGSSFLAPDYEVIGLAWSIFSELVTADDGHPNIGKDLKRHLLQAGFTNITSSASFTSYSTADEVDYFASVIKDWFLSADVRTAAMEYGVATQQHFDNLERALKRWISSPNAFGAVAYGESIAYKPPR